MENLKLMPQENMPWVEEDSLDNAPFPYLNSSEVDRIVNIGDRTKDILLAKLGDDYAIDAVDDDFFSWEIRHADMNGVVGGYFYYAPTQVWTRIDCYRGECGELFAPPEIRELVRTEVNQQLRAIKDSSDQGTIA